MLSVSDARERILAILTPVDKQTVSIGALAGRVLAGDIRAKNDFPLFDNSSVDGFALQTSDIASAGQSSSHTLQVIADIRAGAASGQVIQPGQCARIMTGAPMPAGADAVSMVEDTNFNDRQAGSKAPETVAVYKPLRPGENVRRRGADMRAGDKVLSPGRRLRAQEMGLLAMLGISDVPVYRKPKVALLSSGDELLPVEAPLTPGKIHDSNSFILASLSESAGVELIRLGVASDSEADVRTRLERAVAEKADIIISSAGVSMGAFDYVKAVVESDGELDFWKVNMRPGKPLAFGKFSDIPFFGLPGNPVSAYMGFEVFVRPALEKLSGQTPRPRTSQKARLAETVESDGRESYLRAIVTEEQGQLIVRLTGRQSSGDLLSLVQANALLIVPSGVKSLPANSEAQIWLID